MTISNEITRIQTDKVTIRNKLIELGLADSTANLDALATAISSIIDKGSPTAQVRVGETYTILPGYYQGGSVAGVQGSEDFQLQAKSATPTKAQQQITPDTGYYGLSAVTVGAIPAAYQDVSQVDATAGDVLANKIIVTNDGTITTGTMPNNGKVVAVISVANPSYTVPAGYHNGQGTVSIVTEEKTATPTESSQEITPTSGKVLSKVTVNPIPSNYGDVTNADAVAGNILDGKFAVVNNGDGDAELVEGTMPNNGAQSGTLSVGTTSKIIPAGYTSGGTVSITLEEKSATPTTSAQNITPASGKVLSKVVVGAIPAIYGDATNADAVAANILDDKKAIVKVNNAATLVTGSMPNNGAISGAIDGLTTTSYTVPAGYTSGGSVSLTNDIETALAAI